MKKLLTISIILCLTFLLSCDKYDSTTSDINIDCSKYPITTFYNNYDSQNSALQQIPAQLLENYSTDELIQSLLMNPYWKNILLSSSMDLQKSFESFKKDFNGLTELNKRDDFPSTLLERYLCCGTENYYFEVNLQRGDSYVFSYMEILISQDSLLRFYDDYSQQLMTKALEYYHSNNEEGISVFSLILMGKIMLMQDYKPFLQEIESNESVQLFLNSGNYLLLNPKVIQSIYNCAINYNSNNLN